MHDLATTDSQANAPDAARDPGSTAVAKRATEPGQAGARVARPAPLAAVPALPDASPAADRRAIRTPSADRPVPADALSRLLARAVAQRRAGDTPRHSTAEQARPRLDRIVDQHAGTHLPTDTELREIDTQINPTAPKAGAPAPAWDGEVGQPDWEANRATLKKDLTAALEAHLKTVVPRLKLLDAGPRLAMTAFEGPGRAAKRVVDGAFGSYASAAALTEPQQHTRDEFAFKAGKQLRDRTNPKDFTPDPDDIANWMAQTTKAAATVQRDHHLNKDRSTVERDWLDAEVLDPFVAAHKPDLALYDMYGFASASPGEVLIAPTVRATAQFPDKVPTRTLGQWLGLSTSSEPSPAERLRRWRMWQTLVHEYIHTLEHPAFKAARRSNRIFSEGFCEMFTEEVLQVWIPRAKAGDAALRREVEGADAGGQLWPDFTADYVSDYSAGEYLDYATRAKAVRAALGGGGKNAVRAAFFQGHIELIGLGSDGKIAAAPSASPPSGMRWHRVVASSDLAGNVAVETPAEIATQNGITVAELRTANAGVDLTKLTAGQVLLIAVRT